MTVKELIEKLKNMPQEIQVEYEDDHYNWEVKNVELRTHNDYDETVDDYVETEYVFIS